MFDLAHEVLAYGGDVRHLGLGETVPLALTDHEFSDGIGRAIPIRHVLNRLDRHGRAVWRTRSAKGYERSDPLTTFTAQHAWACASQDQGIDRLGAILLTARPVMV